MGLFTNLSQTKLRNDFIYFSPGNYLMRIDTIKQGLTRTKELFIAINCTVIAVLPHSEGPPNHTVGEEVCHYIKVSGNEYAQQDWCGFVCGVLGVKTEDLDKVKQELCGGREIDEWCSNEDPRLGLVQPLRGVVAEVNNKQVNLQKKKDTDEEDRHFTRVKWKRTVEKEEYLKLLNPEQVKRFFPGVAA